MGKVHVLFGEPVPLREGLAGDDPNALNKVAFEVCARINRVTPVTPTSLVTLALLGAQGRAVTRPQAQALIEPALRYVERRGFPGARSSRPSACSRRSSSTASSSATTAAPSRSTGSAPTATSTAAFYRNISIHWFVNRAIVELSLAASTDPTTRWRRRSGCATC